MTTFENTHRWLKSSGREKIPNEKVLDFLKEEVKELEEALYEGNHKGILDAISDILVVLGNVTYNNEVDLEDLKRYIHCVEASNWSKFCASEEEAIESCKLYKEGLHPDKKGKTIEVNYKKNNDYYILTDSNNKIMKSHRYIPAEDLYLGN